MLINPIIRSLSGVFVCDTELAFFSPFNLADGKALD